MSKKNFHDQQETNVYSRIIILGVKVFLEKYVRIRDPIHGMIELNEGEAAIIKKEAFQRLKNIHQLALTSKVYPGATHTRFEHSLGVMHLAGRVMDSLYKLRFIKNQFTESEYTRLHQLVRLTGLLHDLGHAPFSHGSEDVFPPGLKHEHYTIAIIRRDFTQVIKEYFPDIKVEEIITLLNKGYLGTDQVFLGKIIEGEMDADKLDYLLRDSYYCGVRYGKYDLERILDTVTVVAAKEAHSEIQPEEMGGDLTGFWLLGIDSDGIQALEELIFARYWMFIQVYFHKTRRIYDYYLTAFLKDFLQRKQYQQWNGYFPPPDNLNDYLALDDCTILEAIKKFRNSNEWARRIFERDHLSEAFVTLHHHTGLASYLAVAELKEKFEDKYGSNPQTAYVDDKARRLLTNPFFGLKKQEEGDKEAEEDRKFDSIVVQDKHNPEQYYSIFRQSLPLQLLSQKGINIVRFYVTRDKKEEAAKWCNEQFAQIQAKIKKIEEGWT